MTAKGTSLSIVVCGDPGAGKSLVLGEITTFLERTGAKVIPVELARGAGTPLEGISVRLPPDFAGALRRWRAARKAKREGA